jgi:xylulokinase
MDLLLGIDVGTTNCKAMVYDVQGNKVAGASRPTPTLFPRVGWAVYDPQQLWEVVSQALREVVAQVGDPRQIRALAVASMGEAGIPLDDKGNPLYPAIAWFDPRSEPQSRWWAEVVGALRVYQITGLPLHPMYSLNKIMWLRDNEPQVYRSMARWLCLEDFVIYKLSGGYATSHSIASRTMAFDLLQREWSQELLGLADVDPEILPPAYPSGAKVGEVIPQAALENGLAAGTAVVTGGHDHVCGALALGVFEEGLMLDSTGTAEAIILSCEKPLLAQELLEAGFAYECHVAPGRYVLLGVIITSGAVVEWFKEQLGQEEVRQAELWGRSVYDLLLEEAEGSEPGARGLFLLPHLAGSCTPGNDPCSKGAFLGLTRAHTKGDLIRAIIEGLCYELRLNLDTLQELTGIGVEKLRAIGGATKSEFWLQTKADVTGKVVECLAIEEATSLGAALLAGMGAGLYRDEKEAVAQIQAGRRLFVPDQRRQTIYEDYYQIYCQIYPTLRELNHKIHLLTEQGACEKQVSDQKADSL